MGSTITSLIYASFTFIFFALEAAVMAKALELCFGSAPASGAICSARVVRHSAGDLRLSPFLNRFQFWTQIVWVVLQAVPLIAYRRGGV